MHGEHGVEVFLTHLHERAVAHNARVVHEDVDFSERVDGGPDDPFRAGEVRHRVVVGNGLAPERLDLLAHLRRRVFLGPPPIEADSDVVDHDLGALAGHAQRELTSDAPPRAGHDRDASVEQSHRRAQFTAAVAAPVSTSTPS